MEMTLMAAATLCTHQQQPKTMQAATISDRHLHCTRPASVSVSDIDHLGRQAEPTLLARPPLTPHTSSTISSIEAPTRDSSPHCLNMSFPLMAPTAPGVIDRRRSSSHSRSSVLPTFVTSRGQLQFQLLCSSRCRIKPPTLQSFTCALVSMRTFHSAPSDTVQTVVC